MATLQSIEKSLRKGRGYRNKLSPLTLIVSLLEWNKNKLDILNANEYGYIKINGRKRKGNEP